MKTVLLAKNIPELLFQINNNKDIRVVGGCTNLTSDPEKIVSTHGIKELSQIIRHERYIDAGPGTKIMQLINVGVNHIPQVLYDALISIANPLIQNIATIGGNICHEGQKLTLFAPLMVLDAKIEYKNQTETHVESILNFKKLPEKYILTNIMIPIPDSNISIFRRIGPEHSINEQSASFAFIATTEKNTLVEMHLAFAGPFAFRSRQLESNIMGHKLPLTNKDISGIMQTIESEFNEACKDQMISEVMIQQFLNLARYSFEQLT